MLSRLKKLVPSSLINSFHYTEALTASFAYRQPTKQMVVIGVVGSKGKTTLANLLWAGLSGDGSQVGLIGTANIRIGQHESLNPYHMTMPGRHYLQKTLAQMRAAGCTYVVMEVPSEGQAQWRHVGIYFDVLIFTNVTRELMASHKYSLELLHEHNQRVFHQTERQKSKTVAGRVQPKILIANADARHFTTYFAYFADIKRSYSLDSASNYRVRHIEATPFGSTFVINKHQYSIQVPGIVNVSNAAGAIAAALELGKTPTQINQGLKQLSSIPGRMERIEVGQNFTVIVDYAHEETGMAALMAGAKLMRQKKSRIITLLGAEGGGRDEVKRPIMGKIAMQGSDYVIISNVDPYRDNPEKIIADISKGVESGSGKLGVNYWRITDRRAGIKQALSLARENDIVFITGKGSEQTIVINGHKLPWDDRKITRQLLRSQLASSKIAKSRSTPPSTKPIAKRRLK